MPGIGVGFVPAILNRSVIDEVLVVTDDEAFACSRRPAKTGGILAGVSAGAALYAALVGASRPEAQGRIVVVLLPDIGERYLSTALLESDRPLTASSVAGNGAVHSRPRDEAHFA